MSRALVIIEGPRSRAQAALWVDKAPEGTRVEFKQAKRSNEQNSRMWAMLTEIARQVTWKDLLGNPLKLTADQWKIFFLAALKAETVAVPSMSGVGIVNVGRSSSDLSVTEMGDLMTVIEMFGATHGVVFHEPEHLSSTQGPAGGNVGRRVAA